MKLGKIAVAILATVLTVGATTARAQVTTFYTTGDLLLGFEQNGNASDYLLDIGQASLYTSTATLTLNLSTVDLSNVFGPSWASNSQTNLVQWGVVGNNGSRLYYTQGRTNTTTQTTPPLRGTASAQNQISANIQNLETGSGGYDASTSTANSSIGIIQTVSSANSYGSVSPGSAGGSLGIGNSIEQPSTGSFTGPTNSILDLYTLTATNTPNQPGTFLGTFSLSSGGVLTFTGASAVPEPSTYALLALGIVFVAWHLRRKSFNDL